MAYQPPPGPYPVMPTPPVYGAGAPPRPPIPQAALRSYYAILTGAVLSAASIVVALTQISSIRTSLRQSAPNLSSDTIDTAVNFVVIAMIVFGLIGVLLWLWMAWKIRTGRHWARVLSSVFFGISVLSNAIGIHYSAGETSGSQNLSTSVSEPVVGVILGWVSVLVGLYAMVMFWHKSNAHFFRPQLAYPPYGQSYYPNQPYPGQPYPGQPYPQMPMQQGSFMPPPGEPQQQPSDPWSTPPQ